MANVVIPSGHAHIGIEMRHAAVARPAFVTFGVQIGFPSPNDLEAVANEAATVFAGEMAERIDESVRIGPGVATVQTPDGYASVRGTVDYAGEGVQGSPPPNVAVLCRKVTGRPGRFGRGRFFIPWGIDETGIDEAGAIESAVVNAYNLALAGLLDALSFNDLTMVLLHGEGTSSDVTPDVVTGMACDSRVATQRRRLRS